MTCLTETTYSESLAVDRETGVIRGVRILGSGSKNGREYTTEAMQGAAKLYEGRRVYIDHPERSKPNSERKFGDCFGQLENVQIRDGAVYGDMHYLKSHEQAEKVCEAAERFPRTFGLSHNAEGRTARRNGKVFVESVTEVRSVDIVSQPATNNGLFESEDSIMKTTTIREVLTALPKGTPYRDLLLEMEGDEAAATPMPAPAPAEDMANMSPEDAIKKAFLAKITAIVADDSIDMKETLKKVSDLIKNLDKVKSNLADNMAAADGEDAADSAVAESVRRLQAKLNLMEARDACRSLMESEGVASDDDLLDSLVPLTAEQRKSLLKRIKPAGTPRRLTESSGINPGVKGSAAVSSDYADRWKNRLEKARAN